MVQKAEKRRTVPDLSEDPEDLAPGRIVAGEPLEAHRPPDAAPHREGTRGSGCRGRGPLCASSLEERRITNQDLADETLRQLTVRRSLVEGVSFANARLSTVVFRDVRFVRCDLSNAVILGLEARRVEFVDCRLLGLKAIECRMEDVLLERRDARYAQFNNGALRSSDFTGSQLQEADFRAVNLENTRWARSDLSRADLSGAKLKGADFREAIIEGIVVNAPDVAGAIVSPSQAMELARLLGLMIK